MPPPPWTLHGHGLAALYAGRGRAEGGGGPPGALLLVRYHHSPVGPYDELIWLDLAAPSPVGLRPRIRRIVVSSAGSVTWGRRNWAMPKTRATFEWEGDLGRGRAGQVRVSAPDGQPVAHLAVRGAGAGGPLCGWPLSAGWLPRPWRTLAQPALDGGAGWKLTAPGGEGRVSPARLTVLHADGLRPGLDRRRPYLTLGLSDFTLHFPPPGTAPSAGQ